LDTVDVLSSGDEHLAGMDSADAKEFDVSAQLV
jgi:hypothetical protein